MRHTIILCFLFLAGCDESIDYRHGGYLSSFSFNNFDPLHPDIIDPYYEDGLFEINWELRDIRHDTLVTVTLLVGDHRKIILQDAFYHVDDPTRLRGNSAFLFDHESRLFEILPDGELRYVANLSGYDIYSRSSIIAIEACEYSAECHYSEIPVYFW